MVAHVAETLRRPDRLVAVALTGIAGIVFSSVAAVQVAHLRDSYGVTDNTGIWVALSKYASGGTLYPPLFDGRFYGGTRYMPLPILLPAGVHAVVGSWIVAEKLVAYSFAVALLVLLYVVLRRLGCSLPISLILVSSVLLTSTGLLAATGLKFDTPSVFFQLAALTVVERSRRPRSLVLAAVLSTLAVVSKLSGVWGAVTIILWLGARDRRALRAFAPAFAGCVAVAFGVLELASSGRMSSNLVTLSLSSFEGKTGADEHSSGVGFALDHVSTLVPTFAHLTLFLLPVAIAAIAYSLVVRRPTVFQLALVVQACVLVVVLGDAGADENHLIDVVVLTAVVVGGLIGAEDLGRRSSLALKALVVGLVLAVGLPFYSAKVVPETKLAVRTIFGIGDGHYTVQPLRGYVSSKDSLLTADPYIADSVGQHPVVLDEFMFQRLIRLHPSWAERLASRVAAKEFDKIIVLARPLQPDDPTGFGLTVNRAIEKSYVLAHQVGTATSRYWIYVPAGACAACRHGRGHA